MKSRAPCLPPMETSPSPSPKPSLLYHQISVLLLTFSAYASFHASRKPPSIVKPALAPDPSTNSPGWSPFGGASGPHRLGELDLAFLSSYSVGMYLAGHAADRLNLRRFLALGMLLSGLSTIAFGLGFFFGIHRLAFFMAVQIAGGLCNPLGGHALSAWPIKNNNNKDKSIVPFEICSINIFCFCFNIVCDLIYNLKHIITYLILSINNISRVNIDDYI